MPQIYSKALDQNLNIERIIGRLAGKDSGGCLIFLAGVHGNEPSGVFALTEVFKKLSKLQKPIRGSVYGIAGNLWALEHGERFHTTDLNRLWTTERISKLESGSFNPQNRDEKEQLELQTAIDNILKKEKGPFYFFDLHTTSVDSIPFLTINDSMLNRKFTRQYPLASILGIEEHLDGPVLSYLNELGYVSFGFEGGQHDSINAIENHTIFILLTMVFSGILDKSQIAFDAYIEQWNSLNQHHQGFYEIYEHYQIKPEEQFTMKPGFKNFQTVSKGVPLAVSDGQLITAKKTAKILMPLYQSKGLDGYFLVKPTPSFFLWLSGIFRRFKVDRIFPLLPGVSWASKSKNTMRVDLRIARFIAHPLLHLFGYRTKKTVDRYLYIRNREHNSRHEEYKNEKWYST